MWFVLGLAAESTRTGRRPVQAGDQAQLRRQLRFGLGELLVTHLVTKRRPPRTSSTAAMTSFARRKSMTSCSPRESRAAGGRRQPRTSRHVQMARAVSIGWAGLYARPQTSRLPASDGLGCSVA